MDSTTRFAGHIARLRDANAACRRATRDGEVVLPAEEVGTALGVRRQAGGRTLFPQDNLPLRLLLEERRRLGLGAAPEAGDGELCRGSLILAARGAAGPTGAAVRGLSVFVGSGDGAPVCAFSHAAALRRYAAGTPVTTWVTESRRAWEIALRVARREVVVDPGETSELHVGVSRLRRLLA